LSETAVSYAFEQLEPSASPPRDAGARLLARATAEAQEIRERARAEGFEVGRRAGLEHGAGEIVEAAAVFTEAARGLQELRDELSVDLEKGAIELALMLAGKILAGALEGRPELVVDVVQGALRRIADRRRISVLVNPGDLERVREAVGTIISQGSGVELCEVISEERVPLGGAIVRTSAGEIDASVHTQLERAREVMSMALDSDESAA
jgi:flagellar assembly protein FliH